MFVNIQITGCGTALVLFHGWGFDSSIWQPILPFLQDYQVFCVDLPGFGLSDLMEWQEFKSALGMQLPEKFAVLGWSLGGLYASRLAIEEPAKVTHLINIASSPRFLEDKQWLGVKVGVLQQFYNNLAQDTALTLHQFKALQKYSPIPETVLLPSKQGLKAGLDILQNWDLRMALAQLKLPVCFMFGRLDAIIPAATLENMRFNYPEFHYVLFRKSAHMPFLSESTQFLAKLKAFIL